LALPIPGLRTASKLAGSAASLLSDGLGLPGHRRVWSTTEDHDVELPGGLEHAQIEARGIDLPEAGEARKRLKRALEQLDAVHWAEVNALTSRIAVSFDGGRVDLGKLIGVVEGVEEAAGLRRERLGERHDVVTSNPADHPADLEPLQRALAALIGDCLGLGLSVATSVLRRTPIPIELASLVSFVDNQPRLRALLERRLGPQVAEVVLALASAIASGVAQGPTGIVLDMANRVNAISEIRARRRVWCQREPELYAHPRTEPLEPPPLQPRPVPVPAGPVEQWADRISLASMAGFAVTLAATRSVRQAADAFLAGTPKAAKLGREAFAAQLGRTLADRGVVPMEASALRRLDRVDTVVVDSALLDAEPGRIDRVLPLADDVDADELSERAHRLFDAAEPAAARSRWGWRLEPLAGVAPELLPRGAKARAAELSAEGGRVLAFTRGGRVEGLVHVVSELDPAAALVVSAIRRAGHRFVVAGRKGAAGQQLGADARIRRGRGMVEDLRSLQAEGAVVLAIARGNAAALGAADVAVGLVRKRSGRPPWTADLLCGAELADAAFIIDATAVAAEVSRRSALLALGGSSLGAVVALTARNPNAARRGFLMVNGAGAVAMAAGTWAGITLARRPRPPVLDRTPWHTLETDTVLDRLESSASGLAEEEARRRQVETGRGIERRSAVEPFLEELDNPLTPILGGGAGLAAAVGSVVDAAMVASLIGVNTLVGGVQRLRTERAVADLLRSSANEVEVVRAGEVATVVADELVPGDVVHLEAGDVIPSDCRVLEASGLEVDESTLTGESLPVPKQPDACAETEVAERSCMLYEGTTIAAGSATAVVVATGAATEAGRSIALADAEAPPASGVEVRLRELTKAIMPIAGVAAAGVVGAGILRRWPVREIVSSGVSLAVASVPEGLPFVATAAQLAAARRLSERGALVRNPSTLEALGRVDVLCFDKTGTLTEGRITLQRIADGLRADAPEDAVDGTRLVLGAALRATPEPGENNAINTTDEAILEAAGQARILTDEGLGSWARVTELPFEAGRGLSAVLGRCADGHRLSVKGAPESVLPACEAWRRGDERRELDDPLRAEAEALVEELAAGGYRVLAVAERVASDRTELDSDRVERLELLGLLALSDTVRESAAASVSQLRRAGVGVLMITGDHPGTAAAIAAELGILEDGRVLTGTEVDDLDDAELDRLLPEVRVVARATPSQKVRIVRSFQRCGRTVAMTGDGANDAASIRLADVGVALGERGTAAARDAADLVVTDDRLETIIDAIVEGRALWGSVREAIAILVGGNLGEIGFSVVASFFSAHPPMNARQFLLVNLMTDLAPAMAVAVRPPDTDPERILHEGPEESLGAALTSDITVRAVTTGVGATGAWMAARLTGSRQRASTVGLVALVGTQLGQTILAGAGGRSPLVVATGAASTLALAGIVQTPGLSQFFGCRPMGPVGWLQAGTAAATATGLSAVSSLVVDRVVEWRSAPGDDAAGTAPWATGTGTDGAATAEVDADGGIDADPGTDGAAQVEPGDDRVIDLTAVEADGDR
jgi:cation-transporting P-type ATPase I